MSDVMATKARLIEVATACVEQDRADSIIFGCMTMSFLDMADEISASVGIPSVNAGKAALKQAETLVSMKLAHSRTAYAPPPKVTKGQSVADLKVG